MSDVTALIVFHGERHLVATSITSFGRACDVAVSRGVAVSRIALLDRPDAVTRRAVTAAALAFDRIETVDFGDLGMTRNAGMALASTTYAAFFDGDDLWGAEWVFRAHQMAEDHGDRDTVYHPQVIAKFVADDHRIQSPTAIPPFVAESHFFIHQDSRGRGFDPRTLVFCNVWTANVFAHRSIYERFPYRVTDRAGGFGIEDWTWNMETLVNGIEHVVVPDTVHCIRAKPHASLGRQHVNEGLVPPIHEYAARLEEMWDSKVKATATAPQSRRQGRAQTESRVPD